MQPTVWLPSLPRMTRAPSYPAGEIARERSARRLPAMNLRPILSVLVLVLLVSALRIQAEDAAPAPTWTVPVGWQKADGQRPMRVATFTVAGGEVAISQLGGNAGGLLANVNRWCGQVGLAPVTAEQLPALAPQFEITGFTGNTMRLKGAEKHLVAAVIYEPKADRTWFVKLLGPPALADQHEAALIAFAKSFAPGK